MTPTSPAPSKILVTGANGFVGRHLLAACAGGSIDVVAATRSGSDVGGKKTVAVGEIGAATNWSEALEGVATVIHLAGRAHVLDEKDTDPARAFEITNTLATANLAHQAKAAGVTQFIFISSISVYSSSLTHLDAAAQPSPETDYGRSKWLAEKALRALETQNFTVTVLRPPLVYGPDAPARFGQLLRLSGSGLPLPIGGVDNRRTFVAVDNLADAILHCVGRRGTGSRPFLVADNESLSTPELVRLLRTPQPRKAAIFWAPPPLIEAVLGMAGRADEWRKLTGTLTVDASAFKSATGWHPPVAAQKALIAAAHGYAATHK
ncbi:MAG: NAD-dependent epimerase/dehydratase family protein [Hyphomicrobiaceae bacterium]|nr:NAD-dependent epimerase/dehydratase family protein [Hyphomicrobiaceae bacterium]